MHSSVHIAGNILTSDILQRVATGDIPHQLAKDFGVNNLRQEIQTAWADVLSQYDIFKRRKEKIGEGDTGTSETRAFWMMPLLQLLGYHPVYNARAEEVNGKSYMISHRDGELDGFPMLIMGCNQSLDQKPGGRLTMSPHVRCKTSST